MIIGFLLVGCTFSAPSDMPSDALALAAKMGVGWNLGDALESVSCPDKADETSWGNPRATKELFALVKAAGFNAIRLPCAWSEYIVDKNTYRLNASWLARVKEVVSMIVDLKMYVMINIHYDCGWLEEHVSYKYQANNTRKLAALWKQIATTLGDFDEHVLFAGMNENHEGYGEPSAENIAVHTSYLQTFVDTVRGTGGKNLYRNLIVQAYRTDIKLAQKYMQMPKDGIQNRLFLEIHYYDPWDFCGENGKVYLWGKEFEGSPNRSTWGQEEWVQEAFGIMKTNFVDKGIPVILGEYSVSYRGDLKDVNELAKHNKSRNHWYGDVTKSAVTQGSVPFVWDNGFTDAKQCGLFDRRALKVAFPDVVKSIISAANSTRK